MKILIVDDVAVNLYLLEVMLRSGGYEFVSTANGIEALDKLRTDSFDAIISDILMPKMDGFQLLRECKKDPLLKNIPFIVYTATYTEKKDEEFGLSLGAIRYIIKPSEPDILFQLIKEAFSEHARSPRDFSALPLPDDETFAREYASRIGAKLEKKENLLKESEEKFRLLYENSMDAILLSSPDGSIQAANPAACAMFQQTEEDIIRNGRAGIIDTTDPRLPVALAERTRNGRFKGELTFLRKDGARFFGEVTSNLFMDRDGQIRSSMFIRDITERKLVEDALVESELRYRSLFENMLEGFAYCRMLYDKGGRPTDFIYINVNPAFNRIVGTSVVVGKPVTEVFPGIKEAFPELFEIYGRVVLTGEPESFDLDFVPSKKWLHISVYALAKDHFVAIFEDITERKQAEEALRESEHEFRSLAEAMPQIVWVTRADGWNIYFNQQWVDYTGLTLEESYGHGWNTPFHPDDQQRASDAWQKATDSEGTYALECRLRRADGAYRWWLIRGVPLRDTEGNILKWFGTCTDIESIKRVEEELACKHEELNAAYEQLAASEEELRANYKELATSQRSLRETTNYLNNLLDYANAPIIVWDPSQRITRFNHAFERLTGRNSDEVIGQPLEILFPPQSREHSLDLIKKTMSGERWETVDIPIFHVKGSIRTVLWNSATLLADDQTTVVATIAQGQDISERKLLETTLIRINQKLNVITNLTRQDLSSQIFVLSSYLELTKKQLAGQDHIIATLQKGDKTIRLIHETIEYSKDYQDMGAKPPKWQNVKMTMLLGLSHISIGKIQHSLETENLEIFADPLLEKVCQRLFENSVAHGDHVTLVRVWHTGTPDGVNLVLEDDGIGIPQEKKKQIFSRDEDSGRASMRSLIFVREILDITGITIKETGEPGKGARFEMTVPKGMWRDVRGKDAH